jgi:hypothetical protein
MLAKHEWCSRLSVVGDPRIDHCYDEAFLRHGRIAWPMSSARFVATDDVPTLYDPVLIATRRA